MKYKLWFNGGRSSREASSMREALRIARGVLGSDRVYRGAQYLTDEPRDDGDRAPVEALDVWASRRTATAECGSPADCVITWPEK